MKVHRWSGYV